MEKKSMDHAYFKQRIKKRLLCAEGRQPSHYLKCQYLDKKRNFRVRTVMVLCIEGCSNNFVQLFST